MKQAADL